MYEYILKDARIVYTKIVNINAYYESNRSFHDSVKSKYSKKYYVKGDEVQWADIQKSTHAMRQKKAGSVIFRQNNLHIQDNIRIF